MHRHDRASIKIWVRGYGKPKPSKIPNSHTINARVRIPWIGTSTRLTIRSVLDKGCQIENLLRRMTRFEFDLATPDIPGNLLCYRIHSPDVYRYNVFDILPASLVDETLFGTKRHTSGGLQSTMRPAPSRPSLTSSCVRSLDTKLSN